jgi:hypothetical protein
MKHTPREPDAGLKAVVLQVPGSIAALIILPPDQYQPAACCDGRLVAMVVNREGVTRCVLCDAKEEARLEQESRRIPYVDL